MKTGMVPVRSADGRSDCCFAQPPPTPSHGQRKEYHPLQTAGASSPSKRKILVAIFLKSEPRNDCQDIMFRASEFITQHDV
jgi:hypothetical protein